MKKVGGTGEGMSGGMPGGMPAGFDPSQMPAGFDPSQMKQPSSVSEEPLSEPVIDEID